MWSRPIGSLDASVIGLGTWAMGGWMWGGRDDDMSIAAIHASLDAGVSLIDTAPIYGFGHCEEIVGRAIRGRRDQVVLATKCGMVWDRDDGEFYFTSDDHHPGRAGDYRVHKYLGPCSIRAEVERSLRRLGVDTIDLYQTHWQDATTPIQDSMGELLRLRDEGKIREIGASNCEVSHLRTYEAAGGLASVQEKFSLIDRRAEEGVLVETRRQGLAFLAYAPLAMGLLTGQLDPDRAWGEGDQRAQRRRYSPEARRVARAALATLDDIAFAHDAPVSALVLARTLRVPGVTHLLCGARDPAQARANAVAGRLALTCDEIAAIDAAVSLIQ